MQRPRAGLGAYAASKAGLEHMSHSWRIEHPWLRFTTVTVGDTPGIGVDHLTIRSPSPRVASFMETFAALADEATEQGEIDG